MPNDSKALEVASTKVADYVPSLVVLTEDGYHVRVPLTYDGNQKQSQVIGSKLRMFIEKQIDLYSKSSTKQEPAVIRELVAAASKIEEINRYAFAPGLSENEGAQPTGKGMDAVKAVAEGFATAQIKDARAKQILDLGKNKDPKIVEMAG